MCVLIQPCVSCTQDYAVQAVLLPPLDDVDVQALDHDHGGELHHLQHHLLLHRLQLVHLTYCCREIELDQTLMLVSLVCT